MFPLMYKLKMFVSNEIVSEIHYINNMNISEFFTLVTYKLLRNRIDNQKK